MLVKAKQQRVPHDERHVGIAIASLSGEQTHHSRDRFILIASEAESEDE